MMIQYNGVGIDDLSRVWKGAFGLLLLLLLLESARRLLYAWPTIGCRVFFFFF